MAEARGREAFLCAPGMRIEAQERLAAMQFAQVNAHLGRIEAAMERLERRLWLTVFGVAAAVLGEATMSLMNVGG